MRYSRTALFALAALLIPAETAWAQGPQKWSVIITRPNLNAFDDAQQQASFDRIKKRTNGQLDISTAPIGTLPIKDTEWLRALRSGDLSMGMLVGDYHGGDFPLLGLLQTPFLYRDEVEKRVALTAAFPILQREANKLNIHLIAVRPVPEIGFWSTEPIADITNLGGRKIRAQAKLYSDMVEAAKGVPVPIPFAEAYTALQRGLVKGIFTGFASITGSKIHEVAPYGYGIGLNNQIYILAANKQKWDALPAETRIIAMEEFLLTMQVIQASLPDTVASEIDKQKAGGLKEFKAVPSEAWFRLMSDKIAKETLKAELARSGAAGEEVVAAMEAAIGRKLR
jgi:TRAP-type C4-dicarboxylate transport system substrate-binding protein